MPELAPDDMPLDAPELMPDEAPHFRILYRLPKLFQLASLALDAQLDAAIRQIPHRAGDIKTARHRFGRVAKPDSLHAPGVEDMKALAAH